MRGGAGDQAPGQLKLHGNGDGTQARICCKVAISHGLCVAVHLCYDVRELYENYHFNQNLL